jgi:ribosomal protein L37E
MKAAICRSCPKELFNTHFERCVHPLCGCPRSEAGTHPWKKLHRCPADCW